MTNVRITERFQSQLTVTACVLLVVATGALKSFGQDGASIFQRTPSGSAGSAFDINRRGLGMSFRGGHIAGGSVGRQESVTHAQVAPYVNIGDGLFHGDLRLLRANEGGLAWGFGSGYRHYVQSWDAVVGGYGYFDRDQLTNAHFKQWSVGGEVLAHGWEMRGNYYEPFGTTSELVNQRADQNSAVFVGNTVEFSRIDTFAEALKGFDVEVGWLLPGKIAERLDLRAFGGGYSYQGENIPEFAGWSTRLQADIADRLEMSLKLTDDELFHTTVSFSAAVHFGGFQSQEHTRHSGMQRMAEPVRRNINIASAVSDVTVPGQVGLDPNDGLPFNIIHVNSNAAGPGTGTVEDPFTSLSTGLGVPLGDIVFVHAGSSFNAAPENTVVLADSQNLFGEGLITSATGNRIVTNTVSIAQIGNLILPSSPTFLASGQTLSRPTLFDSPGDAVTLGDNSRFGGFILSAPVGHGIVSDGQSDTFVTDTLIENAGGSGVRLVNTIDSTTLTNVVIDNAAGPAFHVDGGTGAIGFVSTSTDLDPSNAAIINSSQEAVLIENMTSGQVNMVGSTIDDTLGAGIVIRNTAANATVDNARIIQSTGTGIAVSDSSGVYTFRNTLRDFILIENATGASVLIENLAATGRVNFEDMEIIDPQAGGIDIDNNSGIVTVSQDITIGQPNGGTSSAISVDGAQDGSRVVFNRDLTVDASNGRGIEIINGSSGSTFLVNGLATVNQAVGESIAIVDDAGAIGFSGGVSIDQRLDEGILIDNATGTISFEQATSVNNTLNSPTAAVDIQNSEALIVFEALTVLNATGNAGGGAGVHLVNNGAPGVVSDADILFQNINIGSVGGVGFFGDMNRSIRVLDGDILTQTAAAVNISNSGININLETVNSLGSPDWGIRLLETNVTGLNFFTVGNAADQTTGLGQAGSIQGAGIAGVQLENHGITTLRSMVLDDNEDGIVINNTGLVTGDDFATRDEQRLELEFMNIMRSNVRGIDSVNLSNFIVSNSVFDDNGDRAPGANNVPPGGRETIRLQYTEVLNDPDTEVFSAFENPYVVDFDNNTITDNSDDAITISNSLSATGAHIDIDINNNTIDINDNFDFDPADLNETAIEFQWNGVARMSVTSNIMNVVGANAAERQFGLDLQTLSLTDEYELLVQGNTILTTSPFATGLNMQTLGPTQAIIDNNLMDFDGVEGTGMSFRLASNTNMDVTNNILRFDGDGGAGIIFNSVSQPSSFEIAGNQIGLFDGANIAGGPNGQEEGIRFRSVAGTVNLFGTQNNLVVLLNPGGASFIEVPFSFVGNANGQILVNGALVP